MSKSIIAFDQEAKDEIASALFDALDVKGTLEREQLEHLPKDNEGTEITIVECISEVILFLENLEKNLEDKSND